MPRTLPAYVEAHRDDDRVVIAHLITIVRPTAGTLYWTDAADSIAWDSKTWVSMPFEAPGVTDGGGSFDAASVVFDDVDGDVRAAIAADTGDIAVTITELWADEDDVPQAESWLFSGYLADTDETPGKTVVNLGPGPLPDDVIVPAVRHTRTCPLAQAGLYRGELCGFAGSEPTGETHCGGQYSDCVARGNEDRFWGVHYQPESKEYRTSRGTVNLSGHLSGRATVNPTHDPGSTLPPVAPFSPHGGGVSS